MDKEIAYKYEIAYSQSSIAADAIMGGFFLVGGIAVAVLVKLWLALLAAFVGLYLIWRGIERRASRGPQLKIGRAGIWTATTGHLSWAQALPAFKVNTHNMTTTTYFVILNRRSQHTELARFDPEDLDVDSRSLTVYLDEFAPQKLKTII